MKLSILGLMFAAYGVFILSGCSRRTELLEKGREIASFESPDGFSRAFVWIPEGSGFLGATNSTRYQVWIKYAGGKFPPSLLLQAYRTNGVKLFWKSVTELEICYEQPTHIADFSNFYEYAEEHWDHLYSIEVLLKRVQKIGDC